MTDLDALRYPIGPFQPRAGLTAEEREELIQTLDHFPADLRFLVESLPEGGLDTPYREGGWTVRQVVHHLPDSHLMAYARFKKAMTEDSPTIMTYEESLWAELEEARTAPVEVSLDLLGALHRRWALFLKNLVEEDFGRTFQHPELGEVTLEMNLQMYVWHSKHHLAHITRLAEREGW